MNFFFFFRKEEEVSSQQLPTNLEEMILAVEDVDKAEDEYGGHVEGEGDQEHEEVAVVPSSWKWTILLFYVSRLPYSLWPGLRSQYIFDQIRILLLKAKKILRQIKTKQMFFLKIKQIHYNEFIVKFIVSIT